MKGWLVGIALVIVLGATGIGLWVTWDATQATPSSMSMAAGGPATTRPSRSTTTTTATPPAPACTGAATAVTTDPDADWATTVVDPVHGLPEAFTPTDLTEVDQAGFDSRDQVRSFVIADLAALRGAAQANGTPIVVISGYRSYSYQSELFADRVAEVGEAEASARTARPGHSEHQLGTVIDVLDPGVGVLTTDFAATPAGQWVAAHAHEHGFVLSYPEGAQDRSCHDFEPWHLRYVGRDVAAEIHESGLTPREWMLARAGDGG